jgi:putative endonuclease
MGKVYCVYILASRSRILYTGVTSQLLERVKQHREGLVPGFTTRFRIHRLVYFESFASPKSAIMREKQIKGFNRAKKVALIEARNPTWEDLAENYFVRYPRKAGPSPAKGAGSG